MSAQARQSRVTRPLHFSSCKHYIILALIELCVKLSLGSHSFPTVHAAGSGCLRTCACCPTLQGFRCRPSPKTPCRRTAGTKRTTTPTSASPVRNQPRCAAPSSLSSSSPSSAAAARCLRDRFSSLSPRPRQEDSLRGGVLRLGGRRRGRPQERRQLQESQEGQD